MATTSGDTPPPSGVFPNGITLHVLSPASEVADGRLTFQDISLDTTVSQLKERLQNSIPARPLPERQRLIYRGRALVEGSLSLKNIFQSELDATNTSSTHTLHLVLPPSPQSNNPSALPPVTATFTSTSQTAPVPPIAHHPPHGHQFPHQAVAQAQATQMFLQNQLNLLQQQLAMNNPMNMTAEQMAQMQAQQLQRLAHQMAMHQQQQHHARQQHHAQQQHHVLQQHHAQQPHHHIAQQEQTRTNPEVQDTQNSDHAIHVNQNQSGQAGHGHPLATPLPMGPTTTTIHEGVGSSGSRMRVVVNETVNYHVSRQSTPVPAGPGTGQLPSANVPFQPPNGGPNVQLFGPQGGPLPAPPPLPFPLPHPNSLLASGRMSSASAHGQHGIPTTSQPSSAHTTAWLLSTPSGPQALVFAPSHGYFTAAPASSTAPRITLNRSTSQHGTRLARQSHNNVDHNQGLLDPPLLAAANGANAGQAQVFAGPREQQQRQADNDENDLFHLILQRGWLFLRLYIFMFVLSEPGTWRRWFLLAVAVMVCLLPRENPLRDLANRIRAHIDGLIPIAAAPDHRQQGQGADNERQARAATNLTVQQPSPEQAAARIVRQNRERQNHGVVRDAVFRVERAMALFLASLVPGVGERHVRAREEARREAERIENERLAEEEKAKDESKAVADGMEQGQEIQGEPSTSNKDEDAAAASSSG